MPIIPGQSGRAADFINESERSLDPADDAGKCVKLESDGKIDGSFLRQPQVQVFTSSGNYTPTAGTKSIKVEVVGGGAGGRGAPSTTGVKTPGGGAGGYALKHLFISEITAPVTITIGSGGSGGSGSNDGSNGGTTSFGTHVSATGGVATGDREGGIGVDGDFNVPGGAAKAPGEWSGGGGDNLYGAGGAPKSSGSSGNNGRGYGGGGGGVYGQSGFTGAGGNGADGVVIITEYF